MSEGAPASSRESDFPKDDVPANRRPLQRHDTHIVSSGRIRPTGIAKTDNQSQAYFFFSSLTSFFSAFGAPAAFASPLTSPAAGVAAASPSTLPLARISGSFPSSTVT